MCEALSNPGTTKKEGRKEGRRKKGQAGLEENKDF
jgi:hypothetical protein